MEAVNGKTGMTHSEARDFIRNHFEEFVNRKSTSPRLAKEARRGAPQL